MSKDDQDWQVIDTSKPTGAEAKVEFEIETPPDVAAASEEVEQPTKEEKPAETGKDELEGVETAGAQKRIKQLLRRAKEAEERAARVEQELQKAHTVISDGSKYIVESEAKTVASTEKQIQDKLVMARDAFKRAHEGGDSEALLKAQEAIADATTDLKLVQVRKGYLEDRKQQTQKEPAATKPAAQPVDKLAQEWSSKNDWFGDDEGATAFALSVDAQLKREGFDVRSTEFYEEIDRRVSKRFPEHYKGAAEDEKDQETRKKESRPSQTVAGQSRTPAPAKKVKLTSEDVRLAQKWGIPLEKMAAEKLKVELASANGDYTNI